MNISFGKRQEITVRELGGCMAPIWHNYYKDCHAVLVTGILFIFLKLDY